MCQAYYSEKIMDILEQMILGAANTPLSIERIYQQLNLSMCSLNLESIPKNCHTFTFSKIFEFCVRNSIGIVIGVYKRIDASDEADPSVPNVFGRGVAGQAGGDGSPSPDANFVLQGDNQAAAGGEKEQPLQQEDGPEKSRT